LPGAAQEKAGSCVKGKRAGAIGQLAQPLQSGDLSSAQKLFSSLTPRGSLGVDTFA
jgi:hypothetical protein